MSTESTLEPEALEEAAAPKKRATKKAATKKAAAKKKAEPAAEEAAPEPIIAAAEEEAPAPKKRATKKAAKKAAVAAEDQTDPSDQSDLPEEAPAPKKRAAKKASKKAAAEPVPEPIAEAPVAPEPAPIPETATSTAPEAPAQSQASTATTTGEASPEQPGRRLRWWEKRKLERKARQAARAAAGGAGGEPSAPRAERPDRPERPERGDRPERGERPQRGDRPERAERLDNDNDNDRESGKPIELGPPENAEGLLDIGPKGHAFLRLKEKGWASLPTDAFVHADLIRKHGLRQGMYLTVEQRKGPRGPQVTEVFAVNGVKPEELRDLPLFEELKAINPNKRYQLETTATRYTTRVVDMLAPVGRGQRGLIVSPPRAGKTTMLQHIGEAIIQNYENVHLMFLLVDERPEEVTEIKRSFTKAEVFASSNDQDAKSHARIAEMAIERAKRLVEMGQHVFLLMDSVTRLARAYNNLNSKGATQSGGLGVGSMEVPRRLFAAARNTRTAGSLTILATALIETGSRMDDAIFQEFKGTGNMELVLDRKIAEQFFYPAVNIFRSGTRREELLLQAFQLEKIHFLRRGLAGHKPIEAVQRVLSLMERYPSNAQMLIELSSKEK